MKRALRAPMLQFFEIRDRGLAGFQSRNPAKGFVQQRARLAVIGRLIHGSRLVVGAGHA
ncbi:hypothetical protein [Methylosinus sporium]|uniref:hypothetical protein n=1 Tax=Methylosinus sporium TaxID=428 RepID=UPI00383BE4E9